VNPSVTYTGTEVAILAGIIAGTLPTLEDDDWDVADLLLDRALAALPQPLSAELAAKIERQRIRPADQFWARLIEKIVPGLPFDIIDASAATGLSSSKSWLMLEHLLGKQPRLKRLNSHSWEVEP
jgi:hypothetical protein